MKNFQNIPKESNEELYENAPCGYITFLADGTILKINNTLLHLLEYKKKKEVVEVRKIQDFFKIGGRIYFETHFFPLIKMQGFIKEINFDLLKKDGSFFPALLNVDQISVIEENSVIYRASVLDITNRKNYEKVLLEGREKAEDATRAKAEFLSTISHEIRTPLNAIVGIGNLIQQTSLDAMQRKYAGILQHSSSNLLELVNNLLDLSKLEADKVKMEESDFSLNNLLEVLLESFKPRAKERKVELKMDCPGTLQGELLGDPVKLNHILTNLLGNAIKFTKEGHVKLKVKEIDKTEKDILLQFTVCDTGMGIPKNKLKKIFLEFSQASYDVNLEYGGSGLGLTICQKLLQMQGSKMMVKSEEGKGSEFSFNLKFKFSTKTSASKNEKSRLTELLSATGARVLVVDDSSINLFITSQYLKSWGLAHDTVDSGEAALKNVKEFEYDIVLLDLQMPKMNGFQTSEAIRKLNPNPTPVIIALSGSARGEVDPEMKKAGINASVPKPFDPAHLQELMLHFLNNNNTGNTFSSLEEGMVYK